MKITAEDIRRLCTASSFNMGMDYYHKGSVNDIRQFGNRITAHVSGTSNYKVTIDIDGEDIKADCSCPYGWGGYCKHIAAALFALSENMEAVRRDKKETENKIENIFSGATPEELKQFLLKEFEKNPVLMDHLAIYFSGRGSSDKSLYDYKKEISLLFSDAAGSDGFIGYGVCVDFESIHDLADIYIGAGNVLEALKIFQALFETIAENMGWVDDSDGYYGDEFLRALGSFTGCIKDAALTEGKKSHIKYLFKKYMERDPDYFQQYYYQALKDICFLKKDLLYWKELLKPHIPLDLPDRDDWHGYYQAKEFIIMQLRILDLLDEGKIFYDLIKKFYKRDHEICNIYADRLERDSKNDQAVAIAEEGISLFPAHQTIKLRRLLDKYYKDSSKEKYIENLIFLFVKENDWSDYNTLKELYTHKAWKKMIPVIAGRISKDKPFNRDIITDIYLKEEMFEEALEKILKEKSLSTLSRYHKDLTARFPKKYFKAYKELIIAFLGRRTGRKYYREIVGYLRQMQKIKGFQKEFMELVASLKEKYKNRPAFLDEIESI